MPARRLIVFLFLWLPAAPVWSQTGIERIDAFLDNVGALHARFEQSLFDEESTLLEESSGEMYLRKPGQFRWDYDEPYPQSIVSNGETLWIYDSELSQVTIKTLDVNAADSPSLLLTSDEPMSEHFIIQEAPLAYGLVWVRLTPKSSRATFSSVRVAFDGEDLRMMEMLDNFGQMTKIHFSDIQKNSELPDDFFDFVVPQGVDVISDVLQ